MWLDCDRHRWSLKWDGKNGVNKCVLFFIMIPSLNIWWMHQRMGNVQIKFHFIKTVLKSERILRIFESVFFFGYFITSTWPSLANRIHIRTPVVWILWFLCTVFHLCVGCCCQYIWILSMGEEKVEIYEWNQHGHVNFFASY